MFLGNLTFFPAMLVLHQSPGCTVFHWFHYWLQIVNSLSDLACRHSALQQYIYLAFCKVMVQRCQGGGSVRKVEVWSTVATRHQQAVKSTLVGFHTLYSPRIFRKIAPQHHIDVCATFYELKITSLWVCHCRCFLKWINQNVKWKNFGKFVKFLGPVDPMENRKRNSGHLALTAFVFQFLRPTSSWAYIPDLAAQFVSAYHKE